MNDQPQKKFTLAPAPDDGTRIILGARWSVMTHPKLLKAAKLFFCLLLDLSLNPETYVRRGIVRISTTKLCEFLSASPRAIWKWHSQLVAAQVIWIRKHPLPNMYPMNEYHITALSPKNSFSMPTEDGLWGNGYRRSEPETRGSGARAVSSTKQHLILGPSGNPISSSFLENAPAKRTKVTLPAVENTAPTRTKYIGQPHNLRFPDVHGTPPNRTKRTIGTAQNDASPKHETSHSIESQVKELDRTEIKGAVPPQVAGPGEALEHKDVAVPALVSHEDLVWRESLYKRFDPEVRTIQADLKAKLKTARSDNQKALLRWKIEKCEERLFGPNHPDETTAALLPAPTSHRKAPANPQPAPITESELLESARAAVQLGVKNLPANMREALQRAGDL